MDTDRNLLFGVLALHLDLVTGEQFARACMAWSARKQESLGAILVEEGLLSAEERADVERLLERKLRRTGGDVRASLAEAVGAGLVASLASVADDAVQRSLAALPAAGATTPGAETIDEAPKRGPRYTRTGLHASGGIGEVWLAHDAELGRNVALKQLKAERADEEAARTRFLNEARITGQLEHPGIVPVYELVRGEDGRPFYTMRLVKGRTLTEAVKAYHERRRAGKVSPLDLRELLNAFVVVCQVVAYAHSRGVLHRDLKGSNVVVGKYSEVVVLDWGLAKVTGGTPAADAAGSLLPVDLAAECPREGTLQGQVLGTPAYMAPEQAEGQWDQVGPATDVYGLGAILYEILTGGPPFSGENVREVLNKVISEEPSPPLKAVPRTPRALDAVCRKAMAKRPADRYGSPTALARDVECYLADEPTSAYREGWTTRLARWGRRHRLLVVSAVLMVPVLALGTSTLLLERSNRERQRSFEMVEGQADYFLKEVSGDLLLNEPGMQPLRQSILVRVLDDYQKFLKERPGDPRTLQQMAEAKRQLGELFGQIGQMAEGKASCEQAMELYEGLLRERPADRERRFGMAHARHALADLCVQSGEPADAKKEVDRAILLLEELKAEEPRNVRFLRLLARGYDLRATAVGQRGGPEMGLADNQRVSEILIEALLILRTDGGSGGRIRSQDEIWTHALLARGYTSQGLLLNMAGRNTEAAQVLQAASAAYRWLVDQSSRVSQFRHGLAVALLQTGRVEIELGRPSRAEPTLRESFGLMRQLVNDDPYVKEYRASRLLAAGCLSECLFRQGRIAAAAELLREANKEGEEVLGGPGKDRRLSAEHARLLYVLACLERETGNLPRSLEVCQKAREKLEQVCREVPGNRSLRSDWLATREELARCRVLMGDLPREGWIVEQQAILAERRNLAGQDPLSRSPRFQGKAAESAAVLAGLMLEAGHPPDALACLDEALPAHERLVRVEQDRAKNPTSLKELLGAGTAPTRLEPLRSEAALPFYLTARPSAPEDATLRQRWAVLLARKGAALASVGRDAEAVKAVQQAVGMTEGLLRGYRELRCPPASPVSVWSFLAEELYRQELYWQEPCYLYDLACQLALASILPDGAGIPDPAGRAVEALHTYIASGFDNPHRLDTDPALKPLRKRGDFQKLVRDLGTKARRKQEGYLEK
jgi:serine/threonine-protein kinase